jgi:hypothetical protein
MFAKKDISLEKIHKILVELQRDVALIKKTFIEEPELREDFVSRMRDIDLEESMSVEDFGERYGLK